MIDMKKFYQVGVVAIVAVALVLSPACYEPPKSGPGDVKSVVQKVKPAVVRIETKLVGGDYGSGSGVIIDGSGYILTSNHVVKGVDWASVTLADGRRCEGRVIARDENRDTAIVKVTVEGAALPVVALGDSEGVEVGEEVIVIGYPLGLEGGTTVSKGIVSAFRMYEGIHYIQTDAAVNPGNSGGPLVNLNGEMIAVVTLKYVHETVEGMALAVAVNDVMPFIVAQVGGIGTQGRGDEPGKGGATSSGSSPGSVSAGSKLGGCITFQADNQIWTMNADGSNQRQLTYRTGPEGCIDPCLSPDGKKIAYVAWDSNPRYEIWTYDIYTMNADGSNQTRLTDGHGHKEQPAWSPDGKKIAFILTNGGPDIYVINADGSNQTQLTSDPDWDIYPAWAPDSSKIIWVRDIGIKDSFWVLFVMNADGSNQIQLIFPTDFWDPKAHVLSPAWSPDGKKIAFSCFGDIYTMNPDGRGWRQLTSQSGKNDDPAWSPDGKKIVFSSNRDGNWELYVMDANGRNETRLTRTPAEEQNPAWSPR
jgi:Tol biopolymer transport system component